MIASSNNAAAKVLAHQVYVRGLQIENVQLKHTIAELKSVLATVDRSWWRIPFLRSLRRRIRNLIK